MGAEAVSWLTVLSAEATNARAIVTEKIAIRSTTESARARVYAGINSYYVEVLRIPSERRVEARQLDTAR